MTEKADTGRDPQIGGVWSATIRHWPIAFGLAVVLVLHLTGIMRNFADGLVVAALIYLAWGVVRGSYRNRRVLWLEAAGFLVFGVGTLLALTLDDASARVVLAIGWIAHATWDVYHYRRDIVVARWWAEQCAVVDIAIAGFLLWPLIWR